jgi:hypothetical protein
MAVACFRSITWGIFLLIYGMILVEVNCEPYNLVIMISPDFVVKNLIWGVFFWLPNTVKYTFSLAIKSPDSTFVYYFWMPEQVLCVSRLQYFFTFALQNIIHQCVKL